MILYKHYTLNKNSISALIQNKVWMAKPETLNDPYEFKLKEPSQEDFLNNKINNINNIQDLIKYYQKEINNYGIAAFTELKDNILMWSHYSDNHYGFCIGIDIGNNPKENGFYKINYLKTYPKLDFKNIWNKKGLMKILWTKSIDWEYEKEYRIINTKGGELHDFQGAIKEVIFGARMSEDDEELLKNIFKNQNVRFYKAEIHKSKYKINIKKV